MGRAEQGLADARNGQEVAHQDEQRDHRQREGKARVEGGIAEKVQRRVPVAQGGKTGGADDDHGNGNRHAHQHEGEQGAKSNQSFKHGLRPFRANV